MCGSRQWGNHAKLSFSLLYLFVLFLTNPVDFNFNLPKMAISKGRTFTSTLQTQYELSISHRPLAKRVNSLLSRVRSRRMSLSVHSHFATFPSPTNLKASSMKVASSEERYSKGKQQQRPPNTQRTVPLQQACSSAWGLNAVWTALRGKEYERPISLDSWLTKGMKELRWRAADERMKGSRRERVNRKERSDQSKEKLRIAISI